MISDDTLSSLYERRKKSWFQVHAQMQEFRDYINGDIDVDLPELDRRERSAVARLGLQGLNQLAMRVASITAEVTFPPLRPGIDKWEDKARQSREVTTFWTQRNALGRRMRRRARHLIGYSMSPVFIRPRFGRDWDIPEWDVRDPLMCLPNPHGDADDMTPPDCIFPQRRSLAWLKERYPDRSRLLRTRREPSPDDQFEVIEFVDDAEWVLMAKGVADDPYSNTEGADYVRLDRIELRTDRCPVVIASRITLDRLQGHFDDTIGIHQYKAKLFALAYIAARKGVLPETWLEGEGGSKILVEADAEAGIVGHVTNGRLRELKPEPGYLTMPILSALEREMRIEGGTPAEFSGESATNVRTGRRGDAIMSATVDFPVQEYQELLADSLREELRIAIGIDKSYHDKDKQYFFGRTRATYKPSDVLVVEEPDVSYAHAGTDANGLVISGGQRVGLGAMSLQTFREIDPLIGDAEREKDRVLEEALDRAAFAALEQQANAGTLTLPDLARIKELIRSDRKEWDEAVMQVQREAQERQATTVEPVPAGAPEAQAGIAPPGQGAEGGIVQPQEDVGRLTQLLGSLRMGQRTVPQEVAAEQGVA